MTTLHQVQALGSHRAPATAKALADAIRLDGLKPSSPFGINVNPKPTKGAPLLTQQVVDAIGANAAIKINFIPQMLESLAMLYATKLVEYAAAHRISEFKRHSRQLRQAIKVYHDRLKAYDTAVYEAYEKYSQLYQQYAAADIFKMQLQLRQEAVNAIPDKDPEVAVMINAITVFVTSARAYDVCMDEMLSGIFGKPVHQRVNVALECLKALCVDLADVYGFKLEMSPTMSAWVKILTNRAYNLADQLIEEQNVTQR